MTPQISTFQESDFFMAQLCLGACILSFIIVAIVISCKQRPRPLNLKSRDVTKVNVL